MPLLHIQNSSSDHAVFVIHTPSEWSSLKLGVRAGNSATDIPLRDVKDDQYIIAYRGKKRGVSDVALISPLEILCLVTTNASSLPMEALLVLHDDSIGPCSCRCIFYLAGKPADKTIARLKLPKLAEPKKSISYVDLLAEEVELASSKK